MKYPYQHPIGPSFVMKVAAGDTVKLSTRVYYESGQDYGTTVIPVNDLITALTGTLNPGALIGESAGTLMTDELSGLSGLAGGNNGDQAVPDAYLNNVLFDQDMNYLGAGFKSVEFAGISSNEHGTISETVVIQEDGYMLAYVSNESNSTDYVHFDDFTITHIKKREVRQINHYYPFGLTMNGAVNQPNTQNPTPNTRLFNAGSELQELSNLYDTYYRQYDASLGRFNAIDPKASLFKSWSPYSFGFNDPVYWNDPMGDCPDCWDAENYIRYHPGYFYSAHHADSHMSTGRDRLNRYTGPGSQYYWTAQLSINPKNGQAGYWVDEGSYSEMEIDGKVQTVVTIVSTFYPYKGNLAGGYRGSSVNQSKSYSQRGGYIQFTDKDTGTGAGIYNSTAEHASGINTDFFGFPGGNGSNGLLSILKAMSAGYGPAYALFSWLESTNSEDNTNNQVDSDGGTNQNEADAENTDDLFEDKGSKEDKAGNFFVREMEVAPGEWVNDTLWNVSENPFRSKKIYFPAVKQSWPSKLKQSQ